MIIYRDKENKCHTVNDGTMTAIETDYFNGKCSTYIEGFCWEVRENGEHVYAWKPYSELEAAQREYERQQLADYKAACERLGIVV